MIYYIQEWSNIIGLGHIKIGYSKQPLKRLRTLQGRSPRELHLLSVEYGGRARESELHRKFAHLRVGNSEWFDPGEPLLTWLISSLPGWRGWDPDWDDRDFVPRADRGYIEQCVAYANETGMGEPDAT